MIRFIAIAAIIMMPIPVLAQDMSGPDGPNRDAGYVKIFGGGLLSNPIVFNGTSNDFDAGAALGMSIGLATPIDGLSFEIDLLKTRTEHSADNAQNVTRTSLMIDAVYNAALTDALSAYGLVGVGILNYHLFTPNDGQDDGMGFAYQLGVGVETSVTEKASVFAELRYQDTFADMDTTLFETVSAPSTVLLGGLRYKF